MAETQTTTPPKPAPTAAKPVSAKAKASADDPMAVRPGTGSAGSPGPGVRREPTEAEDKAAKEQAKEASEAVEKAGTAREAAAIEARAITDGASVLGKEAVVVQGEQGQPVVSRRGMSDPPGRKASADNPALMGNNVVVEGSDDDPGDDADPDDPDQPKAVPLHA